MDFDFKSTGRETVDVLEEKMDKVVDSSMVPLGIITPLRPGVRTDGFFAMSYSLDDQLADNLRNLIQTNHGERLGRHDFGANLRELSMEMMQSESFEIEAMQRISIAVSKYLPFVRLGSMKTKIVPDEMSPSNLPQVIIAIEYSVSGINRKRMIETIITLAG